jgi:predicted dehydrogenase
VPQLKEARERATGHNENRPLVRLGFLGCGAIVENGHLPAALAHPRVALCAIADTNERRAASLADSFGLDCKLFRDWHDVADSVDAVVNALPNHLHAPVNIELLSRGIHVLCEKPLAMDMKSAADCIDAAKKGSAQLMAAMPRRYYGSTVAMDAVLAEGSLLGNVVSYDWEHGVPFAWNTASGFYFSRSQSGGGVLLDEGVHLFDLLLHWFGPAEVTRYEDDNWGGGIEANAIVQLQHRTGIVGRLRLSRTYTLKNRLSVCGSDANALILREDRHSLVIKRLMAGKEIAMYIRPEPRCEDPFYAQLEDFTGAVLESKPSAVSCEDVLESLKVIDFCYANAQRIPEPWLNV